MYMMYTRALTFSGYKEPGHTQCSGHGRRDDGGPWYQVIPVAGHYIIDLLPAKQSKVAFIVPYGSFAYQSS